MCHGEKVGIGLITILESNKLIICLVFIVTKTFSVTFVIYIYGWNMVTKQLDMCDYSYNDDFKTYKLIADLKVNLYISVDTRRIGLCA